jgi:hypothetical protein
MNYTIKNSICCKKLNILTLINPGIMKIRNLLSVLTMVVFSYGLSAQDCKMYFPENEGAVREMTNYDKKDKQTSRIVQTIVDKSESGGNVSLKVETVIFDDKDDELSRSEVEAGCVDGVFEIDMSEYLSEMLQAYQTMEIEMEGDNLEFPANISVGDELPDGNINIKVSSSGVTVMNMDVIIQNRKVEGKEKVTTEAGTFDCYKISQETLSKTRMVSTSISGIDWIAEGVGVVKSESYNRKGKLTGYSLLTKLSD